MKRLMLSLLLLFVSTGMFAAITLTVDFLQPVLDEHATTPGKWKLTFFRQTGDELGSVTIKILQSGITPLSEGLKNFAMKNIQVKTGGHSVQIKDPRVTACSDKMKITAIDGPLAGQTVTSTGTTGRGCFSQGFTVTLEPISAASPA